MQERLIRHLALVTIRNYYSTQADGLHSHPYSPSMGADGDENGSSSTRNIVRQLSSTNTSSKPWVPLTPRPNIDPDMFDDPVSNHFYNDVWLTAAIYNVRACIVSWSVVSILIMHCRPRYSGRFSTVPQMTMSQRGNTIKNLPSIKSDWPNHPTVPTRPHPRNRRVACLRIS